MAKAKTVRTASVRLTFNESITVSYSIPWAGRKAAATRYTKAAKLLNELVGVDVLAVELTEMVA